MYDSSKTEVTSIASGPRRTGVGGGRAPRRPPARGEPISAPPPPPSRTPRPAAAGDPGGGGDDKEKKPEVTVTVGAPRLAPRASARPGRLFLRDRPLRGDEPPRAVWTSSEEMVFDLGGRRTGPRVLAGPVPRDGSTGSPATRGRSIGRSTRSRSPSWRATPSRPTAPAPSTGCATAPGPGSTSRRSRTPGGRARSALSGWRGSVPAPSKLEFAFRSGESAAPDTTWSAWSPFRSAADAAKIAAPPGRYLQWKLRMSSPGDRSPVVRRVEAAYRNRNAAPVDRGLLRDGAVRGLRPVGRGRVERFRDHGARREGDLHEPGGGQGRKLRPASSCERDIGR